MRFITLQLPPATFQAGRDHPIPSPDPRRRTPRGRGRWTIADGGGGRFLLASPRILRRGPTGVPVGLRGMTRREGHGHHGRRVPYVRYGRFGLLSADPRCSRT
jgi:hypothetical protein